MRYRGYRRKCEKKKEARLVELSKYTRVGYGVMKETPDLQGWDKAWTVEDNADGDWFKRCWRGRRSKGLKKQYNRKLRNSSKINMTVFVRSDYKRASGDFWWDYD